MKKQIVFTLTSVLAWSAFAGDVSREEVKAKGRYSVEELRARFELHGETVILDKEGKRVLSKGSESRIWRPGPNEKKIEAGWGVGSNDFKPIEMKTVWEVQDDGSIKAVIEQWEKAERAGGPGSGMKYTHLLKRQEYIVQDFAPIMWPSVLEEKDRRVVMRFVPMLRDLTRPEDLRGAKIPVSGTDLIVFDNQGYLWTRDINIMGNFVAVTTHRGTIAFSYSPFAGASEAGTVQASKMEINLPKGLRVTLLSGTAFLPDGMVGKVYARFLPDLKTSKPNSTGTSASNDENIFLERARENTGR